MRPALPAAMLVLLGSAYAAAQDAPALAGNYGNASGCAFARAGQTRDNEEMSLLTPDHFETYATHCSFVQQLKGPGALVITALCGHEGEDLVTVQTLVIRRPTEGVDGLILVTDGDGNEWARVGPC